MIYRVEQFYAQSWLPVVEIAAKSGKAAIDTVRRRDDRLKDRQLRAIVIGNKSGRRLGKVAARA
jgi:hypothetical protein